MYDDFKLQKPISFHSLNKKWFSVVRVKNTYHNTNVTTESGVHAHLME